MRYSLILLFFIVVGASAQIKVKLAYTRSWQLTTPDSAFYTREGSYDSTTMFFDGAVTDRFPNGSPQMTGSYSGKLKNGEFKFYFDNGTVESVGKFEGGDRSGTWKYFFRDGRPRMEVDFAPALGEDAVIHYLNDSTGLPILKNGNGEWREIVYYATGVRQTVTGKYKNHQKDGKWIYRTSDGKIFREEVYKDGKFKRGVVHHERRRVEIFEGLDYRIWLPDKFYYTENFFATRGIDFKTYPSLKRMYVDNAFIFNGTLTVKNVEKSIDGGFTPAHVRSKLYYNHKWELTTEDRAAFVRVCLLDTTNMRFKGTVIDLYITGKPQMKGSYSRLGKEGSFTFFYENGNSESEGSFVDDERMGLWKFYYPDQKIKMELIFTSGFLREVLSQYDSTGKRTKSEIDVQFLSSKFVTTENFVATDEADFTTYPNLRHMVRGGETYLNHKAVTEESDTIYDIKLTDDQNVVVPPRPVEEMVDMYKFVSTRLRYPPNARRAGIQGVVYLQCVVEKTGLISRVSIQKGIGGGCDEAAMQTVVEYAKTNKWHPASRDGKPVRSRVVIPITFKLG